MWIGTTGEHDAPEAADPSRIMFQEPEDYLKYIEQRAAAERINAGGANRAHENITSQARSLILRMEDHVGASAGQEKEEKEHADGEDQHEAA